MTNFTNTAAQKQQGTALMISLMLLLTITIVSVASLKDTMMDENMARNTQNDTVAFQASDAAVNRTLTLLRQDEVLADQARISRVQGDPAPTTTFADIALTNPNYDRPAGDRYSVNKTVNNNVTIEHANFGNPRESCANYDCPFTAHGFNISSRANVANTHASATILQNAQKEPYLRGDGGSDGNSGADRDFTRDAGAEGL